MSPTEMLHFLEGQVIGHRVLMRSLIETHQNRQLLREVFEGKLQVARASTESVAVRESYLDGLLQEAADLWRDL